MAGSVTGRVVALAVIAALVTMATPPIPAGSAPQRSTQSPPGRILFTGLSDAPPDDGRPPTGPGMGPQEIYTMDPDGSDVVRLTYDEWHSHNAAWSPRGDLIAYAKTGNEPSRGQPADQIHVMRSDGSDDRVIMTGDWMLVQKMQWASMAPYVVADGQETGYFQPWSIDDFLGALSWPDPGEVTYTGDTEELPEGRGRSAAVHVGHCSVHSQQKTEP